MITTRAALILIAIISTAVTCRSARSQSQALDDAPIPDLTVLPLLDGVHDGPRPVVPLAAPGMAATHRTLPATHWPERTLRERQRLWSDLNRDGVVDSADLALLLRAVGDASPERLHEGDLNRDGTIDADDLQVITALLGQPLPAPRWQSDRWHVGYILPAPGGLLKDIAELRLADGRRVRQVVLQSRGAKGLRVRLGELKRNAVVMRFFDPVSGAVHGPYQRPNLDEEGQWWSPIIVGDSIGMELLFSHEEAEAPERSPVVTEVSYLFDDAAFGDDGTLAGGPLGCHNDATCQITSAWGDSIRAVGMMTFNVGSNLFTCTGALLNRQPNDASPLFLTANHCISTQSSASSLTVFWRFETATCNGIPPNPNTLPQSLGSRLLKRRASADHTMLGLFEKPPSGLFRLGWTTSTSFDTGGATGIHHPAGTFKRISFGFPLGSNIIPWVLCDENNENCFTINSGDGWDIDYVDGTAEGGSSGSPIFRDPGVLRGVLSGGVVGCASTNNPSRKVYGRFDRAFVNTRYYLADEDIPSVVIVYYGVLGDPGGAGSTEQGTVTNPYNTVHEAFYAVRSGDTVSVVAGNYDEHITLWRPMTIQRHGTSGVVRIGSN